MLAIAVQPNLCYVSGLRAVLLCTAIAQCCFTSVVYKRWLFGDETNMAHARPTFLLSVIGWIFLSILAQQAHVAALSPFFFGGGFMLYLLVLMSVFLSMHTAVGER